MKKCGNNDIFSVLNSFSTGRKILGAFGSNQLVLAFEVPMHRTTIIFRRSYNIKKSTSLTSAAAQSSDYIFSTNKYLNILICIVKKKGICHRDLFNIDLL